jgi:hypothetical protein
MDSHHVTTGGAISMETHLPLKMVAGLTATSRITTGDLNAQPTTTTNQVLSLQTLDVSMTGALVIVETIQKGQLGHTRDHGLVQDSAIMSGTVMATVIKAEVTSEEASTATIVRNARSMIVTGNIETFSGWIHKTRVGVAVPWRKTTISLVDDRISTGMGVSRVITNALKHPRHPGQSVP